MFEKKPSGGYRTKGSDKDGEMTIVVPGGRANLPSDVIHSNLFCLECTSPGKVVLVRRSTPSTVKDQDFFAIVAIHSCTTIIENNLQRY